MKYLVLLLLLLPTLAFGRGSGSRSYSHSGATHVHSYFRSNGTFVHSHYRSHEDHHFGNNWSTKGNVNPYTGKVGTRRTAPRHESW